MEALKGGGQGHSMVLKPAFSRFASEVRFLFEPGDFASLLPWIFVRTVPGSFRISLKDENFAPTASRWKANSWRT
jgi:hypothetical protein